MCPLNLTFLKLEPPQLCDFENEILVLESHCCSCSGSITQALRVEAMQLLRCYTSCIRVVIYSVSSKDIVVHPAHLLWVSMHPPNEFGSLPQFHGSITHVIEMMVLESKRDDQMPLPWLLDSIKPLFLWKSCIYDMHLRGLLHQQGNGLSTFIEKTQGAEVLLVDNKRLHIHTDKQLGFARITVQN